MKKKILAFALVCMMALAVVAPATVMADDTTTIGRIVTNMNTVEVGKTVSSLNESFSPDFVYDEDDRQISPFYTPVTETALSWYVSNAGNWEPFSGTLESGKKYMFKITIVANAGYKFDSTNLPTVLLNSENCEVEGNDNEIKASYCYDFTEAGEQVENVTVQMDNPVYGQKVMSTTCTVSAVPVDSVKVKEYRWEKYLTGTDPDLGEEVTDPEEVFQEGYEYFYTVTLEVEEGYTVTEDTKCTFNGEDDEIYMQGNIFVLENSFTPSEAPEEPTTAAPSDNPKTGDSNNMWLYVLVGVLALGTIGGVALKKKADR